MSGSSIGFHIWKIHTVLKIIAIIYYVIRNYDDVMERLTHTMNLSYQNTIDIEYNCISLRGELYIIKPIAHISENANKSSSIQMFSTEVTATY